MPWHAAQTLLFPLPAVRFAWVVVLLLCAALGASQASAADLSETFKEGSSGDAVCTRCHGANEKKPILSIHLTRHGVATEPGCQACHGSSRAHVQHEDDASARPAVDFVFRGANKSSADVQSRTCLNCHKAGQRIHWLGSAHAGADVPAVWPRRPNCCCGSAPIATPPFTAATIIPVRDSRAKDTGP